MKFHPSARLAALPFALCAVFPALAQSQLKETTVTATRFADVAESLPMGVSIITAEEIRASGVTTVNEAVMRLLGVVGRQDFYGGGDYALDLRGFGETADSNQVVIVDGVRLNEADTSGTRLAGIPIESVEKIEVLRGSGAVLYGEGATGGVIIVTTKGGVGKERRNSASIYGGAGSFGLREARANATLASGGFSIDLSSSKRNSNNHRDNFHSTTEGNSLAAQWSNDWLRLGARYSADQLYARLPGSLSAAEYIENPRQIEAKFANDYANIDSVRQTVFAEALLGDWQVVADAGSRTRHMQTVMWGSPSVFDVEASQYSLRARRDAEVAGQKNQLVIGTDHSQWDMKSSWGPGHQMSNAVYIKDDMTVSSSGTRLSAGLRSTHVDKEASSSSVTTSSADRRNSWELGASQPWGRGVTSYGRIGSSFRLANIDELRCYSAPCDTLKPQTSRDVELGTRWNYLLSERTGKLDVRLYRSALTNEIGFDPSVYANINYDPTLREGVELEASQTVTSTFELRAIAGLRESKFRAGPNEGKDVPLAPKQTVTLRADWAPVAGHRVTGGVNWVASQHPSGDFDNACRMPTYATADVRYAYQWQNTELSLGVNNLLDSKYYTFASRCKGGVVNGIYPEAGRAFVASARMAF